MEQFVYTALENFTKITGIKTTLKPIANPPKPEIDGMVHFAFQTGHEKIAVEIKKEFRNHHLGQLIQLQQECGTLLVIAENIFPTLRNELKAKHIGYLDIAGNAYIETKQNLILIEGQKKPVEKAGFKNKVFTKAGIKVVFQFLENPELINATYREIAQNADVGLDTVHKVIHGLKEQQFILKLDKDRMKINNPKNLIERWMIAYEEKLRPTLEIGTFRFLKEEDFLNWKKLPLKKGKTFWGGEPGGDLLTHYLRPEILTLYTLENKGELIKNYRLIPDKNGNVKAYKKFWNIKDRDDNIVPTILAYTDLMNTGNPRCIETAEKIYGQYLYDKF